MIVIQSNYYTFLDFETTGLDYKTNQIIEVGAVFTDENFNVIDTLSKFVALEEGVELPKKITELTGITEDDLKVPYSIQMAMTELAVMIGESTVVIQNAPFDLSFLSKYGIHPSKFICTRNLSRLLEPDLSPSLGKVADRLDIINSDHHRALNDAEVLMQMFKIQKVKADKLNLAYKNIVMDEPDRPLRYTPEQATVRKTVKLSFDDNELEFIRDLLHSENAFRKNIEGVLKRLKG
ncbi:PolC-type DNA polymerase III [Alkalihalobacillus sp. NPDC078783]